MKKEYSFEVLAKCMTMLSMGFQQYSLDVEVTKELAESTYNAMCKDLLLDGNIQGMCEHFDSLVK
jgi:hypothetical protein